MFLYNCEIISTTVAACAGSIASTRVKMDLFGVIACGMLAALGGGTTRDLLIGVPIFWVQPGNSSYLIAAATSCFFTFFLVRKFPPPLGTIRIADAIVLSLFGMIGTEKAFLFGYNAPVAILMGICTGIAGGLLRDALTGNVPYVFRVGELYATAVFLGCLVYSVMALNHIPLSTCFITGFLVSLITRLAAIRWNWNLPSYRQIFDPANPGGKRPKSQM